MSLAMIVAQSFELIVLGRVIGEAMNLLARGNTRSATTPVYRRTSSSVTRNTAGGGGPKRRAKVTLTWKASDSSSGGS